MKRLILTGIVLTLVLGCSKGEVRSMEDKETGDRIVFGRSKTIAREVDLVETDKQTTLTVAVGENEGTGERGLKFIVTRSKKDNVGEKVFEKRNTKDDYRENYLIDDGYTVDIEKVSVNGGDGVFEREGMPITVKEFHTTGVPTGISFVYFDIDDMEEELLYRIYTSEKVYLYAMDSEGREYTGEVKNTDEMIRILELMRER